MTKKESFKNLIDMKTLAKDMNMSVNDLEKMSIKNLEHAFLLHHTQKLKSDFFRQDDEDLKEKIWTELKNTEKTLMDKVRPMTNKFAKFLLKIPKVYDHIRLECNHGFLICNFQISKDTKLYNYILPSEEHPSDRILTILLYWMSGKIYYLPGIWGDDIYDHLPEMPNFGLICDDGSSTFLIDTYPYIREDDDVQPNQTRILRLSVVSNDTYMNMPNHPKGFSDTIIPSE